MAEPNKGVPVALAQARIFEAQVEGFPHLRRGKHLERQALMLGIVTQTVVADEPDEGLVELIDQPAAVPQPIERDLLGQGRIAQVRLAPHDLRLPDVIRRVVDKGRALGAEGVVPPAQEPAVRASLLARFAPTQRTGKIHIRRQRPRPVALQVRADRAHAGRVGVAEFLIREIGVKARVHRQVFVAASVVVHAADDRRLVHPLRRQGKQFAHLDARRGRRDGLEFTTDALGRIGLQVEHILRGRAPLKVDQHHALRPHGPSITQQ